MSITPITFGSAIQTAQSILAIVRERRADLAQKTAKGFPKTIEAYREFVGRISALDDLESEIVEALNNYQR